MLSRGDDAGDVEVEDGDGYPDVRAHVCRADGGGVVAEQAEAPVTGVTRRRGLEGKRAPGVSAERSRRVRECDLRRGAGMRMGGRGAGCWTVWAADVDAVGWEGLRSTGRDAHELGTASKGERAVLPKPLLELGLVFGRLTRAGRGTWRGRRIWGDGAKVEAEPGGIRGRGRILQLLDPAGADAGAEAGSESLRSTTSGWYRTETA